MDGRKISAADLPEAPRSESGAPEPVAAAPSRRSRLSGAIPYFTGVLSLLAVAGLAATAAHEVKPAPQAVVETPAQSIGASDEVQLPEVVDFDAPPATPRRATVNVRRKGTSRGKVRSVTLSFGAPADSSGSNAPRKPPSQTASSRDSGASEKRKKKRPEKVHTVQQTFALPKYELIHAHKIGTGEHFYSTNREECERRYQNGYIYRGVVGLVFDRQVEGTVPLRTDDGIAAYIWRETADDRLPVHYFRGPNSEQRYDYFTSSEADRQDYVERGWAYLGVVGYVTAR